MSSRTSFVDANVRRRASIALGPKVTRSPATDRRKPCVRRRYSCIVEHLFALSSETPLEGLARVTREVNALEAERIVLNVGRSNRYPTQAQWNALVTRDRGCVKC